MDFLTLIQGVMDWIAVVVAIVATQGFKYFLPSPSIEKTTEVIPGHIGTRFLPFVPIAVGLAVVFLRWKLAGGTEGLDPVFVRGIMSGIAAGHFYKAWKVTIIGT